MMDYLLRRRARMCATQRYASAAANGGGFNQSVQHSNLLAEMECGHEAATSHLLFCGSAV